MSKIETNKIDSISGTSTLKIGETNATTLDFDTGITSVTNIPAAFTNTPAFRVYKSASTQAISSTTDTQVTFDAESFDTDNAFASNEFTVPTGKAGKYFLNANIQLVSSSNGNYYYVYIQKGSTLLARNLIRPGNSGSIYLDVNTVADLSDGDSVKVVDHFQNTESVNRGTDGSKTYFLGYRLIGA